MRVELGAEPDFFFVLARHWALKGRWHDAASFGRLAIRRPGLSIPCWTHLALIFLAAGDRDGYHRLRAGSWPMKT